MKKMSRIFLCSALTFILLLAACAPEEGTPTAGGTVFPSDTVAPDTTGSPAATEGTLTAETETTGTADTTATVDLTGTAPATDTTQVAGTGTATTDTPGIPVTGADVILLECQFCVEGIGNALLVMSDAATFEMVTDTASLSTPGPDTGCTTVDTFGGRQVVLCRGEENTTLTLDICMDGTNCTQLEVELQSCPDTVPGVTDTPGAGAPTATQTAGGLTDTPAGPTSTPTP